MSDSETYHQAASEVPERRPQPDDPEAVYVVVLPLVSSIFANLREAGVPKKVAFRAIRRAINHLETLWP